MINLELSNLEHRALTIAVANELAPEGESATNNNYMNTQEYEGELRSLREKLAKIERETINNS